MEGRWKTYAATTAGVTVAAVVGSKAVDPDTAWYRSLAKPAWQPPAWAFPVVWTPLYASIAWAGGRALVKAQGREQRALAASLGVNLALNAAWNVLFFRRHSTAAGVVGTVLLDVSNAELIRRTARADGVAGATLVPYAVWCAFATALNGDIAYRNR
ncbi:tryptophan-rich sensory protein [Actinomadura sp. GC306]|uniref:TspO/MBR family protein n=1 Tax=Actinomadura sp. GC306 TaxID=2530367 RepID=UPI00104ECF96|nr:TspO/MBR family protein [Actinomadura sp. GC306]TDC69714.1 tryptophan-rich sensory protein [Actinomadura sp. GC306]